MDKPVFYTPEMKKAWRVIRKPLSFTVDIVGNTNCLAVCIYEDEITKMNDQERLKVIQYCAEVQQVLESFGVDVVVEGFVGGPRRIV